MEKRIYIAFLCLLPLWWACESQQSKQAEEVSVEQATSVKESPHSFAAQVERAHKKEAFFSHDLIGYDLDLWFGGKQRMDARIIMATNSSRIRIELADGKVLIYDGQGVYQTNDTTSYRAARFDIFTWPYFFAFPFKLTDPGTQWENIEYKELQGKPYLSEKLSFAAGTGDAPDDWYIAYADQESHQLYCAAYIVTMGRSQDKAEEDPHAITYTDYQAVDGVPIASKWQFWSWRWENGITEQLGRAEVSNVSFMEMDESLFELGEVSKEILL